MKLRIIFMGTPVIARKSLSRLYDEGYEIAAVFTGSDKPKGRGMHLAHSPVKELALEQNTPVFHPQDLTTDKIKSLNCDLIAVVAFGKILKQEILDIPPLGCINIHGSILPKYRGAAPIQNAVLCGETQTGVTSMYMSQQMDAGDIIYIEATDIGSEETSADLFLRLGDMGAQLLCRTIRDIDKGIAPRIPQNHEQATQAPMLTKQMAPIDWNTSAYAVKCKVRALIPWPVAVTQLGGKTIRVHAVDITDKQTGLKPGSVIISDGKPEFVCADGTVIINKLQAPGGKIMDAADFLRGHKIN